MSNDSDKKIDIRGALEALRPLGRQARATILLSEKLEALVGLEDHGKELTASVERLKSEVGAAQGKVAQAEAEAVSVCAEARAKAQQILADANREAEKYANEATAEIDAARERARAQLQEADAVLKSNSAQVSELIREVESLTERRDSLRSEIENLRAVAGRIIG